MVSDYKAVNEQVEKSPGVMPNQEADMVDLLSARFFGKSDLLQGYWQMPLAEEAREMGLFAAAHKCTFFSREIVWCGKVYSQGHVSHDPVRLQGLSDMRRLETAAELMKFLQAMNWLRTSLPRMAEVVAPLRLFLEELMAGAARRMKRVAKNRAIPPAAWTEGRLKAWADAHDLVAHAVTLYHPRPGCQVLMFPGAFFVEWSSHFY